MNRLHRLTLLSFVALAGFLILFILVAEGNYIGFDSGAASNVQSVAINIIFALLLITNFLLSFLSLTNLVVQWMKTRKATICTVVLGVYPILALWSLSAFNVPVFLNFLSSPFQMIFHLVLGA